MRYYMIIAKVLTSNFTKVGIVKCNFFTDTQPTAFDFAVRTAEPYEDDFVGEEKGIAGDILRETFYTDYITYDAVEIFKDQYNKLLEAGVEELKIIL